MTKKKAAPAKAKSKHDPKNKDANGLTPMQEKFVLHYCNDPKHNGTQAAKDAGYSEQTAGEQSYQLLRIPSVRKAIELKLEERFDTLNITGERILQEIAKIAFGNIKQIATWTGNSFELKESDELSDDDAVLLKNMSMTESSSEGSTDTGSSSSESRSLSFGTFDKMKALELLAKNKKLLTDKIVITDKTGLAQKLARARARREAK